MFGVALSDFIIISFARIILKELNFFFLHSDVAFVLVFLLDFLPLLLCCGEMWGEAFTLVVHCPLGKKTLSTSCYTKKYVNDIMILCLKSTQILQQTLFFIYFFCLVVVVVCIIHIHLNDTTFISPLKS